VSNERKTGAVAGTIGAAESLPAAEPPPPPQPARAAPARIAAPARNSDGASRRVMRPERLLARGPAPHQTRGELVQPHPGEDGAHALGDRQVDPEPVRE